MEAFQGSSALVTLIWTHVHTWRTCQTAFLQPYPEQFISDLTSGEYFILTVIALVFLSYAIPESCTERLKMSVS